MASTTKVIRVKELTPKQWEEIFVYRDMSRFMGKEYCVDSEDEHFVYIISRKRERIPKKAIEYVGERKVSNNRYGEASESSKEAAKYKRKRPTGYSNF